MPRASRKKQISFSCREMVSRIWQKKQLLYIEKDMPPIFCQAEDTVLHLANLQVCSQKKKYMVEIMRRNGEFLKNVLLKNGVPEEAILREDQATFTYENAIFSRQVTDLHKIQVKKAILCCKTYHARRSLMYYQLLYPETVIMVCPACPDGITRENWRETETGVEAVTGEIDRIVKQFCLMLGNR